MRTKTIPIADATEAELRQFARDTLKLPISEKAKAETVRQKVAAYHEGPITIHVDDEVAIQPSAPKILDTAPANPADPWDESVTILIQKGETPESQQPVWVSVNGRGLFIKRGVPSTIKRKYVHVIENAIQTIYHNDEDGNMIPENVPSYPFAVLPTERAV